MAARARRRFRCRCRSRVRAPESLAALVARYLSWHAASGSAPATVTWYAWLLRRFVEWCHEHGLTQPLTVSQTALERYQRTLAAARPDGTHESVDVQRKRLVAVRAFFSWLVRRYVVPWNPAQSLALPRSTQRLPRAVLAYAQVERVLAQADLTKPGGLRDRAMMEVLYSTGLRCRELVALRLDDVASDRGTVLVREGKGRKDRVVPVGRRALEWLRRYLLEVRPRFAASADTYAGVLFLTRRGRPMGPVGVSALVGRYLRRAGVARGACHAFRHTAATLMVENGADVRYVQALLGHAELRTTKVYTHVTVVKLREVHAATHPAQVGMLTRAGAGD